MLKKNYTVVLGLMMLLTGCSEADTEIIPTAKQIQIVKESASEPETQPPAETPERSVQEQAELFAAAENTHIYDECHVCDEQEISVYNNYLDWVCKSRMISAAVVLTDHLDGQTPENFSKNSYLTLFGEDHPDGVLILINNDTYQDFIYPSGTCEKWLPQSEIRTTLAQATPALVEKRYADALEILLTPIGEIPAYVFDQTSTLTDAEQQEFSGKIQSIQDETGKQYAILLTSLPDDPETLIHTWTENLGTDALLIIDPKKKQCRIAGDSPEHLTEEIVHVWEEQSLSWAIRKFFEKIHN